MTITYPPTSGSEINFSTGCQMDDAEGSIPYNYVVGEDLVEICFDATCPGGNLTTTIYYASVGCCPTAPEPDFCLPELEFALTGSLNENICPERPSIRTFGAYGVLDEFQIPSVPYVISRTIGYPI